MDKPILDCNLNNPPPNVDRSVWQLKLVSDLHSIWASLVHTTNVSGEQGQKTNTTFVELFSFFIFYFILFFIVFAQHILVVGFSPQFSISTSVHILLQNNKCVLFHQAHVPVSGDILRLSWKDVILSAAGVSAAAKETGGVGGTRPSF